MYSADAVHLTAYDTCTLQREMKGSKKGKKREKIGKTRRAAGDAEGKDGKCVAGDEERTIDRPIVVSCVRSAAAKFHNLRHARVVSVKQGGLKSETIDAPATILYVYVFRTG